MEYIQFLREPEEMEPTEGEIKAIATGRDEYTRWRICSMAESQKRYRITLYLRKHPY